MTTPDVTVTLLVTLVELMASSPADMTSVDEVLGKSGSEEEASGWNGSVEEAVGRSGLLSDMGE